MRKTSPKTSPPRRVSRPKVGQKLVVFEYFDPSASVVALVGEFNQWNPAAKPMKRDPGGLWSVKIRLAPGSYQYKFVINGERWEEDPLNQHRMMNEHGTHNSIREVGANPEERVQPS